MEYNAAKKRMKKYMIIAILLFLTVGNKVFSQSSEVRIVYGYLWVYPTELGSFTSYPSTLVSKLNEQKKYGCSTWRKPTDEELEILQANNLAQNSSYYTQDNYNGNGYSWRVLLVTTKEEEMKQRKYDQAQANKEAEERRIEAAKANRNKWLNLGLPSGHRWKFFTHYWGDYDYCEKKVLNGQPYSQGYSIPNDAMWKELLKYCTQIKVNGGVILKGPNGTEVYLEAGDYVLDKMNSQFRNGQYYYKVDKQGRIEEKAKGESYYAGLKLVAVKNEALWGKPKFDL